MGLGLLQFEAVGCQWVWVCCRMPVGLGLLSDASGYGSAVGCQWVWVCCNLRQSDVSGSGSAVGCQWVWVCCNLRQSVVPRILPQLLVCQQYREQGTFNYSASCPFMGDSSVRVWATRLSVYGRLVCPFIGDSSVRLWATRLSVYGRLVWITRLYCLCVTINIYECRICD